MKEYYHKNKEFKQYVDSYCIKHETTVSEALKHEVVRQVYLQHKEKRG